MFRIGDKSVAKITVEQGDTKVEIYSIGTEISLMGNGASCRSFKVSGLVDDYGHTNGEAMVWSKD